MILTRAGSIEWPGGSWAEEGGRETGGEELGRVYESIFREFCL